MFDKNNEDDKLLEYKIENAIATALSFTYTPKFDNNVIVGLLFFLNIDFYLALPTQWN